MKTRTTEQMMTLGAWAMNGTAPFVRKMGARWVVEVNGQRVPMCFQTKRAAMAHADLAVREFLRG